MSRAAKKPKKSCAVTGVGSIGLVLPQFTQPIPRETVTGVLRMWNYGDTQWFIAENCRISQAKVAAILRAYEDGLIPVDWLR
jgi:hypothetical protein